jgi:hypothetical protein
MRRNYCLDAVTTELRLAGIEFQVETNKHAKIRFSLNGRNKMYVVPMTTSNWDAQRNARAGIRRILRQAATEARL